MEQAATGTHHHREGQQQRPERAAYAVHAKHVQRIVHAYHPLDQPHGQVTDASGGGAQ